MACTARPPAAFGIAQDTLQALRDDVDGAPVDEQLKPLLRYVRTLTVTPSRITPADAQAVFDAGWDERALHDAVSVCGLFNLMNRLVDGLGLTADSDYVTLAAGRLASIGYAGLRDLI